MPDPLIPKLVHLQERDVQCDEIHQRLEYVPDEIGKLEKEIEDWQLRLQKAKQELMEMETRRKSTEKEIGAAEDQVVKKKTAQISVKKNEEYQALEAEIAFLQEEVSRLEDAEIELMLSIDDKKAAIGQMEKNTEQEISSLRGQINHLRQVQAGLQADLADADKAVAEAEAMIPPKALSVYRYVKSRAKRPPYVVPIREHKCQGCHLKVSTDIITMARQQPSEMTRCDSCGRIVYWVDERWGEAT